MTAGEREIIGRYARGDISAGEAAALMGRDAAVADVIARLREAGLPPPSPPPERQAAELAHARELLGPSRRAAS